MKLMYIGIDVATTNIGMACLTAMGPTWEVRDLAMVPVNLGMGSDRVRLTITVRSIVAQIKNWVWNLAEDRRPRSKDVFELRGFADQVMIGVENYIMSPYANAYEAAMLNGVLTSALLEEGLEFVLLHPMQVKKFVRKARDVKKDEIIKFCSSFPGFKEVSGRFERKLYEHLADATVLAMCASMVKHEISFPGGEPRSIEARHWEICNSILTNDKTLWYKANALALAQ